MPQESHKTEEFKCHECGQTFHTEREHREHQEKAHPSEAKGAAQGYGGQSGGHNKP